MKYQPYNDGLVKLDFLGGGIVAGCVPALVQRRGHQHEEENL
jgi:hypothetical protein